eukprot:2734377-Pleurochrysis_carterae.AAC.1
MPDRFRASQISRAAHPDCNNDVVRVLVVELTARGVDEKMRGGQDVAAAKQKGWVRGGTAEAGCGNLGYSSEFLGIYSYSSSSSLGREI